MTEESGWYSEESATFGDRLAAARERSGLSQRTLSSRLGVKESTLTAWENDTKEPRANRLQMLSGMLGVSLSWLMNGEGDGLDAPEDIQPLATDMIDLLAEMRALRSQIALSADKLGQLEKRLRANLRETA